MGFKSSRGKTAGKGGGVNGEREVGWVVLERESRHDWKRFW